MFLLSYYFLAVQEVLINIFLRPKPFHYFPQYQSHSAAQSAMTLTIYFKYIGFSLHEHFVVPKKYKAPQYTTLSFNIDFVVNKGIATEMT